MKPITVARDRAYDLRCALRDAYNAAVRDEEHLLAKCLLAAWQDAIILQANLEELNEITTHE